ncbi:MAG: SH3 domain-containing protein, partial [Gemmatimonadota bacterium]
MTYAPQSSPPRTPLPACLAASLALLLAVSAPVEAQQRRAVGATSVHAVPSGVVLARLPARATLTTGTTRSGWREVTLDGWVATSLLRADRRNGFDVSVTGSDVRLRAAPDGAEIALLEKGMLLDRVATRGRWTHVRRRAWVRNTAVAAAAPASSAARAARSTPARTPDSSRAVRDTQPDSAAAYRPMQAQGPAPVAAVAAPGADAEILEAARAASLHTVPEGPRSGSFVPGTPVTVVGRAGEWVRVRAEGWVRESELKPATGGPLVGVTAAEVRANPDRYVGQTVEWRLQYVSTAVADELRPEMPPGQPYILARGPLPEPGFVYLMVTPQEL